MLRKQEKPDSQSSALCDLAQDAAWKRLKGWKQISGWLSGKRKGWNGLQRRLRKCVKPTGSSHPYPGKGRHYIVVDFHLNS